MSNLDGHGRNGGRYAAMNAVDESLSESAGGGGGPTDEDSHSSGSITEAMMEEAVSAANSSNNIKDTFTSKETGRIIRWERSISTYFVLSSALVGVAVKYCLVVVEDKSLVTCLLESLSRQGLTKGVSFATLYAVFMLLHYYLFRQYCHFVEQRHAKLLKETHRSHMLVMSLFPEEVTKRLMVEVNEKQNALYQKKESTASESLSADRIASSSPSQEEKSDEKQLQGILDNNDKDHQMPRRIETRPARILPMTSSSRLPHTGKPIADFFPAVTIMFCDLVGFTAWSSTREPTAVFTLLESIYFEFDQMARQLGVFKVETIGDCYVAVAGLPKPREDHAIVMARFASHCRAKFQSVVLELETRLGPDTAELKTRTGLHSGAITAGVLRGDKARFQLFGDTMNTTSRIETTGQAGKIQVSSDTAELLIQAGKMHWLIPREDKVFAKGKGEISTYWLMHTKNSHRRNSLCSLSSQNSAETMHISTNGTMPRKHMRLVGWIAAELAAILKEIEHSRRAQCTVPTDPDILAALEQDSVTGTKLPRDELVQAVELPPFHAANAGDKPESITLEDSVLAELHDYVLAIAQAYPLSNPFHNFEHASHVTNSCCKLFARIVASEEVDVDVEGEDPSKSKASARELHKRTHGISSDPLARFGVVFSALIHDVDHPGVPNTVLLREKHSLTERYRKSPAEQNSIDFAWRLLQQQGFGNLRSAIYQTAEEFHRFRQLVINMVISTDIMDRDLASDRQSRWERAFVTNSDESLKGTLILEHVIQASDVVHTMQHWHVYRRFNGRLFEETYQAFQQGRTKKDPVDRWYQGELSFFDNYVIPLANRLNECDGVFGVAGQEYLNYALMNRKEWSIFGQGVVDGIVEGMKHNPRYMAQQPQQQQQTLISPTPSTSSLVSPTGQRLKSLKESLQSNAATLPSMVQLDSSFDLPDYMTVLLVDDDQIFRKLFVRALKKVARDWTILEANSGEEALELVDKCQQDGTNFDLIFMDYFDMGDQFGSEAVKELRGEHLNVQCTICGMSASDMEQIFLEAGANAFCFKPLRFAEDTLKNELERILTASNDPNDDN